MSDSVPQDDFVKVPTRQEVMEQRAAKKKQNKPRHSQVRANASKKPTNGKPVAGEKSPGKTSLAVKPAVSESSKNAEEKPQPPQGKGKPDGKPRLSEEEWKAKKAEWEARKARRAEYEKRRSADNENFRAAMKKAEEACLRELLVKFEHIEDLITEARYTINSRTGGPNKNISFKVNNVRDGSYRGKHFANSKEGLAAANNVRLYSPWKLEFEAPNKAADRAIGSSTDEDGKTDEVSERTEVNTVDQAAVAEASGAGAVASGAEAVASEAVAETSGAEAVASEAVAETSGAVASASESRAEAGRDPYCDVIQIGNYKFSRQKFYSNRFFNDALSDMYIREMNLHAYLRSFKLRGNTVWNLHIGW